MERFLFLVSFLFFKFKNLAILFFLVTFWVNSFFMKGVLLWCLMGVCVDKQLYKFLKFFLLIFMISFHTWTMKKYIKIQIQTTRCQHFGSN
jgi:hypothetical protein